MAKARSPMHAAWRALLGVLWVTLRLPALLIAAWGGFYVVRCAQTLTAPGVPVEYRYESEVGTMLVKAESYQFDVETMTGSASRVRLYAPGGRQVGETELLDFALDGKTVVVRLNDPVLHVRRLADGSFDIARMAPAKEDEEPYDGAFRFAAKSATVYYSDATTEFQPVKIGMQNIVADGADGSFLFHTKFGEGAIVGELAGTFTKADRLWLDARFDKCDAAPLLPLLNASLSEESLGEFANVRAQDLVLDGEAQFWHDPKSGVKIAGTMDVSGHGLRSNSSLRDADLTATLTGDGTDVRVRAQVAQRGFEASYDGSIKTIGGFHATGKLAARAEDRAAVPPPLAAFLDRDVAFNGAQYDGILDTDGEKFLLDGSFSVADIKYAGEDATDLDGRVRLTQDRLVAQIANATWSGVPFSGGVGVEFESGALSGGLRSERGRIEPLAEHFGTDRLKGIVTVNAVLGGTMERPLADLYARGSGAFMTDQGPVSIGVFEARGRMDAEALRVERLTSTGDNGVLTADGSLRWEDGGLDANAVVGGLDFSQLSASLKGYGFGRAHLSGTLERPTSTGRIEGYGIEALGRKVPQLVADWHSDPDRLVLDRMTARAGTGSLEASGAMAWTARSLDAQFSGSGIRLEEWLAPSTVGSLSVEDGRVTGTLDEPRATATLRAEQAYVGSLDVATATAVLEADRHGIRATSLTAVTSGSEVTGSGAFDFDSRTGSLQARFEEFPLSQVPLAEYSLALDGLATGDLRIGFDENGLTAGEFTSDLKLVAVNGTAVGQGSLEARLEGRKVTAEANVGSLERYFLLSGASYDLDSRQIGGSLLVYNILLQDVIEAVKEPISGWPEAIRGIFQNTTGLANADLAVSGVLDNPEVDVLSLSLTDLTLRGRTGGELRMKGARRQGLWSLDQFGWQSGDTSFEMTGQVSEAGDADLKGTLTRFHGPWLNTLFPDMPLVAGTGDVTFAFNGPLSDPKGTAKINAAGIGLPEWPESQTVTLKDVVVSVEDRLIEIEGGTKYQALDGRLHGLVPFSSLMESEGEARQPMNVQVDLQPTQFSAFAPYISSLDPAQSVGTVEGSAWIVGLWGEFTTHAELRAKGESLVVGALETPVRDIDLTARWDNGAATMKGSFSGDTQGRGALDLQTSFPDLFAGDVTMQRIKDETTVSGSLSLTDFRTRFTLPTAERASRAVINTPNMKLAGTLGAPEISGDVSLTDLYVRLPQQLAENKAAVIYSIDPRFNNVTVRAEQGSRLDSGTARIDFFGTGRLGGSLQNPDVTVPLTVTGGTFDMPTARIAIESGGSIGVSYHGVLGAPPSARVDLNLEGHTTVSARRLQNEYETYYVTLLIRGNLLDEAGLFIVAASDPPDLTSEQIMAILGQKELIENLARHGSDSDFRESLYTVALPTAANILTTGLARDFGLDYIALDYNPFDQAMLSVGKTVTRGFMLQASRQLQQTAGERLKYGVQLNYRPPMRDPFFSRLRLSLGWDQDVPWRVGLNWGRRF